MFIAAFKYAMPEVCAGNITADVAQGKLGDMHGNTK
ncbi:hypothetical protein PF005_g19678 [Phytophthora fragariae]|uniref:Uncharacterized protein n=1 Tax=Phytophthora fragariae TaxID=53985 RepID=A0A6A3R5K5_9STRA|nr:hypothetical protein PF003_g40297 [Phytophthora fragariae]KAE8929222.1 hypothetical protein PF009_g20659 [Phytophthora fragariae]KAE8982814.1 hypothetical protein PF011_g21452 [Phytophthora fragariae]KAE9082396.1 hypothetical protein PF010_g21606 [Phytophthora fragariae]KAE9089041.1 hypothetical protein PF007_g19748 [Phytophthora fragariae]